MTAEEFDTEMAAVATQAAAASGAALRSLFTETKRLAEEALKSGIPHHLVEASAERAIMSFVASVGEVEKEFEDFSL